MRTKQAIRNRYGTEYTVGNIADTICEFNFCIEIESKFRIRIDIFQYFPIDLASGSSIDWVYGTQNVSLSYTFEFRDSERGNKFYFF